MDDTTDLFLSHNWGTDVYKRDNHQRVGKINEQLTKKKYKTWFDANEMTGDIGEAMTKGIERTKVVLVFVTQKYQDKINSDNANDNCKLEFNYATRDKTSKGMIAIVMEDEMQNNIKWKGTLGLQLGGKLYINMSGDLDDQEYVGKKIEELHKEIQKRIDSLYSQSQQTSVSATQNVEESVKIPIKVEIKEHDSVDGLVEEPGKIPIEAKMKECDSGDGLVKEPVKRDIEVETKECDSVDGLVQEPVKMPIEVKKKQCDSVDGPVEKTVKIPIDGEIKDYDSVDGAMKTNSPLAEKVTDSNDAVRQEILQKTVSSLPVNTLKKALDLNDGIVVMQLADEFNFTTNQKLGLKSKQMGGGKPHVKFVDTLSYSGKYIEDIQEAFEQLELTSATEILETIMDDRDITEFDDMKMSDLTPKEISQFYPILLEDPMNANKICWLHLAEELDMAHVRQNIKTAMKVGYIFSMTEGLINELQSKCTKIDELYGKLKKINDDPEINIQDAYKMFEDLINKMVQMKVKQNEKDASRKKRHDQKRTAERNEKKTKEKE